MKAGTIKSKTVVIDPGMPFIHLPKNDFIGVFTEMKKYLNTMKVQLPDDKSFRMVQNCDLIKKKLNNNEDFKLTFNLEDVEGSPPFQMELPLDKMLVRGMLVEPQVDKKAVENVCYLPFFCKDCDME